MVKCFRAARYSPSADHVALFSRRKLSLVTCRLSDPSAFMIQILSPPPRSDVKAIFDPSGEKRGCISHGRPLAIFVAAQRAAFPTLLGGHAISIAVFLGQKLELLPPIHFTIVAGALYAVSLLLFAIVSLNSPAPPAALIREFASTKSSERTQWYNDHRLLSAALLGLTAGLVIAFW